MINENAKMKICLLTSAFYPFVGGGETHSLLLCREFITHGDADALVVTRRTSRKLERKTVVRGVPVYRVGPSGFKRLGKYLMLVPVFFKLLALRKKYDVILVAGLRTLSLPAILATKIIGKRCVLCSASCGELSGAFIWDSPHLQNKSKRIRFYKMLVDLRNRLYLKADGFLAISSAINEEYLKAGVPEEKIAVINNGTDTDIFRPVATEYKYELRKKLAVPEGKIFSYSGKLNKGKGLPFLMRVWKKFSEDNPNTCLLLIGSGKNSFLSCERELRDYVARNHLYDSVIFTGYVENVHEYLQASDFSSFRLKTNHYHVLS
jgi:glycosyltransferase involved in cell wall biosynthesis